MVPNLRKGSEAVDIACQSATLKRLRHAGSFNAMVVDENHCDVGYRDTRSHGNRKSVRITDRTSVQTGAACPRPRSYMARNIDVSVRAEI
ncbi:hypothetical protein PILCRDRAFT_694115 [Piloderma croceum F 1598]|uniref:Uncharacterized protein n=1 Tax=Piloderma croceum (strain F 1598) TaxID=765440 RepID=A0A0C3EQG3_PILCF|nr:hypothetical protein PILCRDRAFT_694115 [Piloderma croceum F 1598]